MSATYSELLTTDRDRIRAMLGDTIVEPEESALHSDEHIAAVLAAEGSLWPAVAWLADELVTRFAQEPDRIGLDGLSVSYSERVPAWQSLAARARAKAAQISAQAAASSAQMGSLAVTTQAVW